MTHLVSSDNASRYCSDAGQWAERTDYSACKLLDLEPGVMEEPEVAELPADLEISIIIYLIGETPGSGSENCYISISKA